MLNGFDCKPVKMTHTDAHTDAAVHRVCYSIYNIRDYNYHGLHLYICMEFIRGVSCLGVAGSPFFLFCCGYIRAVIRPIVLLVLHEERNVKLWDGFIYFITLSCSGMRKNYMRELHDPSGKKT